jgi:GT2 family glycosyltransferase
VQAMARVLRAQGREVEIVPHLPRRGIAEHRASLLARATADAVLFLDDDVWLEPGMLGRMHDALRTLDIGFVGAAVQGLSYLEDRRAHEAVAFTPWGDAVEPERVRRGTPGFDRWPLHNAANLAHIAADLGLEVDTWLAYRIAWVGGCVLYRRSALVETGGFDFWERLPERHSGEDVAAQWRVMERFGGAGIVPSGAVHLEAPTTIPVRDVDAFDVLFAEETPDPQPAPLGGGPVEESTRITGDAS